MTNITKVTSGVIHSPNYESDSYKKIMTDSEVCKINIATSKNGQQHGNIIIFRTVRAESSGPCLQNTVIKRGDVNEECPEEEITTGPQGINLTL